MKIVLVPALLIAVALTACQADQETSDRLASEAVRTAEDAVDVAVAPLRPTPENIFFMDSGLFDNQLSRSLRQGERTVVVADGSGASISQLPERLDRWLAAVDRSGGIIKPEPVGGFQTRGLTTIAIALAFKAFDLLGERMMYAPAGDYNAVVRYDPEGGHIREIIFLPRPVDAKG